jgi:NAD(P)H dehydrogenase (quinone)
MHTLIITAHPSSKGFTHTIANTVLKAKLELGQTAEILDLYKAPRQDFLVFEDKHEERVDQMALRDQMQKKIKEADLLVFVHPMWWGTTPAILKNFLDVNLSSGFSHSYEEGKPVPLLTDKKARVYLTSDAPAFIYTLIGLPYKSIWNLITFRFVGIKCLSVDLIGDMRHKTPKIEEKFLNKVREQAKFD